jgi:hypothetical protein
VPWGVWKASGMKCAHVLPEEANIELDPKRTCNSVPKAVSRGLATALQDASEFSRITLVLDGSWGAATSKEWTRIGAMNLIGFRSSVLPRSVTAMTFDALSRVARWGDWFRPATRVSLGEPSASRWKDLFFRVPGRARRTDVKGTI